VRHVGGEKGRNLGVVVGRIHFYNVAADDLEAGETPQELLRLARLVKPPISGVPVQEVAYTCSLIISVGDLSGGPNQRRSK
jgi:hypothetical protein